MVRHLRVGYKTQYCKKKENFIEWEVSLEFWAFLFCITHTHWLCYSHWHRSFSAWCSAFLKFLKIILCVQVLPACMSALSTCLVPSKARRRHWIPWTWSYRWLQPPCCCWESTPGSLEEWCVFLTLSPWCSAFKLNVGNGCIDQLKVLSEDLGSDPSSV